MKPLLCLGLALLALPLRAHWTPAWSAPGLQYQDGSSRPSPRRPESWERFAVKLPPAPENLSPAALLGSDLLLIWQNTISGKDGSRCPFYPSCSRYSRVAVERYGLTLGVIMTADRLHRCHDEPNPVGGYARREVRGESLIWDPPMLDAWWENGL